MKQVTLVCILILILLAPITNSQETYFGKNKVRYKDFEWSFIQTRHFDIHFYEDAYPTAKFASTVLESSYTEITNELNYMIQRRIPVFVYNSQNDFQQTNITSGLISEGVGGFTEVFKNRIVIPFSGSYEDFRHVLHHELTHAVTFDMLYGNAFKSLVSRQRLFSMPLWLAEGYAEYSSRHGWDYWSDMVVRDATINGYLAPPWALGGYLAYKEGQAMVKYIADKYGEEKLGELLRKGKIHLTMNKTLKETLDITEEEFWEDFSKEMKRRYWPEIADRKDPDEIGKQLTHARKDGSYFNEKPAFSPEGDKIAIFTDKSDYTEIVLISAIDGKHITNLVKSERSGDLESLHSYVSGMSFSPDGESITFVGKSGGKESLFLYNTRKKKTYRKVELNYYNILSPAWSPDGKKIAFSALEGFKRDLFIYDIENDNFSQLTDDRYDDVDPSWTADNSRLIFSSDRPHPQNKLIDLTNHLYVDSGAFMPGDFEYGVYNLFSLNIPEKKVAIFDVGPGQNKSPTVSPDGSKVAFISDRSGIDNLYIAYLDSSKYYAVTDIISGIRHISWSPDGKNIAFSAFNKGAFDIFLLKELIPVSDNGQPAPTDYMLGKYDLLKKYRSNETLEAHKQNAYTNLSPVDSLWEYETYDIDSSFWANLSDTSITDSTVKVIEDTTAAKDSVVVKTGIYDDEYVFVSESEEQDPLDSLLIPFGDSIDFYRPVVTEPPSFDSVPPPLSSGDYLVKKYKTRFTPDYVGGGFSYNTFFGLSGLSYFVFSDYLGNHQIYIATELVNNIDQSFLQAFYFYNKRRTNLGAGFFHTKNYYLDNADHLFSDRFYGLQFVASYPFSTFSRIDLTASQYFIDRQYHDSDDDREDRSSKVSTAELSYVTDNIIWGITGPINGRRTKLSATYGANLFDIEDIEFTSIDFDYRKYLHFGKLFSMAFRFSGGASFGNTPKQYFLGGTTNWIGNRTLDAKVYDVENLYFADVVTPLRGFDYYSLSGSRYGLFNWEFRYPMIDYFVMRFPLAIAITNVTGAIFYDMGSTWTGDNFKFGTTSGGSHLKDVKTGFGFGMRANLGFILIRYDLAWSTDFSSVSDKPFYYFSLGADF